MQRLMSEFEAANRLGIRPSQLRRMARSGRVPFVLLPGLEIRFDPEELRRWLAGRVVRPEGILPDRGYLSESECHHAAT